MVSKIANRYRISRLIGQGGMADVYLAYDEILGRDVAIKVLRQKLADDPQTLFRFIREASAARRLDHPNVVEIYDVGESGDLHYIVMEYVPGQTLKEVIADTGPMPADRAIEIMKKLTLAVQQAHERKIIHRDIKPQNILVRSDGELKISDFGIAIAADSDSLTRHRAVMGSAHYLAPESAAGLPVDYRVDLYSLGIVFFELLCGSVPYTGTSPAAIALKHLQDPLPHIQPYNETVTQGIENVVIRAAAKNPDERFQSAQELYDALCHCKDPGMKRAAPLVLKTQSLELPSLQEKTPSAAHTKSRPHSSSSSSRSSSAGSSSTKRCTSSGGTRKSVQTKQSPSQTRKKSSARTSQVRRKKRRRRITGKSITLWAVSLAGICAITALLVLGLGIVPVDGVLGWHKVPAVEGMSQEEAITVLTQGGIAQESIQISTIASDSYEAGQVQSTSIPAGMFVHDGDKLTLTVVKGPTFLVSDYTGLYIDDVKAMFESQGVNIPVEVTEEPAAGINPGIILAQSGCSAGERIDPDSTTPIQFTVSTYPTIQIDSSYIGRDVNEVKAELNSKGIAVILKNVYGSDTVASIDPPAGSTYTQQGSDSVVTLYH